MAQRPVRIPVSSAPKELLQNKGTMAYLLHRQIKEHGSSNHDAVPSEQHNDGWNVPSEMRPQEGQRWN
eukprot:10580716-Ditylum_brightwellii.AAC.1